MLVLIISIAASSDDTGDDDPLKPTNAILLLFIGLGLGIAVMQILSVWGEAVPYTVAIFILGALFSFAYVKDGESAS